MLKRFHTIAALTSVSILFTSVISFAKPDNLNIEAVREMDGDSKQFYVLYKDQTWETVSEKDLNNETVCNSEKQFLGKWAIRVKLHAYQEVNLYITFKENHEGFVSAKENALGSPFMWEATGNHVHFTYFDAEKRENIFDGWVVDRELKGKVSREEDGNWSAFKIPD